MHDLQSSGRKKPPPLPSPLHLEEVSVHPIDVILVSQRERIRNEFVSVVAQTPVYGTCLLSELMREVCVCRWWGRGGEGRGGGRVSGNLVGNSIQFCCFFVFLGVFFVFFFSRYPPSASMSGSPHKAGLAAALRGDQGKTLSLRNSLDALT